MPKALLSLVLILLLLLLRSDSPAQVTEHEPPPYASDAPQP